MAINIIEQAKSLMSSEWIGKISGILGETTESTRSGINSVIPGIMGGLISKASSTRGSQELMDLIKQPELSGTYATNPGVLFSGGESTSKGLGLGSSLLSRIFGENLNTITEDISTASGLRGNSTSVLMKLSAPFLVSMIGKQVETQHMDAQGLGTLLIEQKDYVKATAPASLWNRMSNMLNLSTSAFTSDTRGGGGGKKRFGAWWVWLLPILAALGIWYFLKNRTKEKTGIEKTIEKIEAPVKKTGVSILEDARAVYGAGESLVGKMVKGFEHLGPFVKHQLPGGATLVIPEKGTEAKLINFIKSTAPVDNKTWFEFDRINFATGSSSLSTESTSQINNITEILKAYPAVKIKIGGYTDNTGNPAANLRLSQKRAEAVMNAIVAKGITPSRLAAEGYGEQYPVASNDTEEGRARNRRIAIRVTEK